MCYRQSKNWAILEGFDQLLGRRLREANMDSKTSKVVCKPYSLLRKLVSLQKRQVDQAWLVEVLGPQRFGRTICVCVCVCVELDIIEQ